MVKVWLMMVNNNLVGVFLKILKNDGVRQWEGLSHVYPYIMENKTCLKPPTRINEIDK